MWDATQYLKYANERARPFFDLLARVRGEPRRIADLGCGPGNLTRTLLERWPDAHVIGVDHSPDMLAQAQPRAIAGRLDFVRGDITTWTPEEPLDLIVSNAAFQWIGDHETLLSRLATMLGERRGLPPTDGPPGQARRLAGGTLAVQIPYHFGDPSHRAIEEVKLDPRWRTTLEGVGLHQDSVKPLAWYVERLHDLGFTVDAWQTTYLHVLTGTDPVLEWFKGSALRPLLQKLDNDQQREFLQTLGARLRVDYPSRAGKTLLPFPRLFFVATRV